MACGHEHIEGFFYARHRPPPGYVHGSHDPDFPPGSSAEEVMGRGRETGPASVCVRCPGERLMLKRVLKWLQGLLRHREARAMASKGEWLAYADRLYAKGVDV